MDRLYWGVICFILLPLGLFFVFLIPEIITEDLKIGLSLIQGLDILRGLFILARPIWGTLLLVLSLVLLMYSEELGNRIVRWFSGK
mgnify:CR=1 FL=1